MIDPPPLIWRRGCKEEENGVSLSLKIIKVKMVVFE